MKRFVDFKKVANFMRGKTVAVVGSAPSCLDNEPGFIDAHDVVVRVNNHKTGQAQGFRTDIHYSFYGGSIRKTSVELQNEGVQLCMCKCPDAKPIESAWHEKNGKVIGIDFRYIYRNRASWWFCDTYVPTVEHFMQSFDLLEQHIPTTGFSAILDVLACAPRSVYLTGFDFFQSGMHNVDEPWRAGHPQDPIGHRPDLEMRWLATHCQTHQLALDRKLSHLLLPTPSLPR